MKQQLLLLEDVYGLGRKGDIVSAKPGYIRNYLLPKKYALPASKHTLKMQEKLQEDRRLQAIEDKQQAEALADQLREFILEIEANVDPEGKLYGSITPMEISKKLKEKGFMVEKHEIVLPKPIKSTGEKMIVAHLKEGIEAHFKLVVIGLESA